MDQTEQVVRQLMATIKCSVCGSRYEDDGINVVGRQGELWFITVACNKCHTRGLVAALVREISKSEAASTQGVGADSDGRGREADVQPLRPATPVTAEDVQEMREFLKGFDGNFARLFGSDGQPG